MRFTTYSWRNDDVRDGSRSSHISVRRIWFTSSLNILYINFIIYMIYVKYEMVQGDSKYRKNDNPIFFIYFYAFLLLFKALNFLFVFIILKLVFIIFMYCKEGGGIAGGPLSLIAPKSSAWFYLQSVFRPFNKKIKN